MTDLPAQGGPIDHGDEPGYKKCQPYRNGKAGIHSLK